MVITAEPDPRVTFERERRELMRTRRALSQEVEDLLRQKAALSTELDAILTQRSSADISGAIEALSEYNQRFFARVVEREIHRCAREIGARFSTMTLTCKTAPPSWFGDFLQKTIRLSDLTLKVAPRTFNVFLSGAGGLGRRLFLSRFARNLRVAATHHEVRVLIDVGGATYPADGQSPEDLIETSEHRRRPLHLDAMSLTDLEEPHPAPTMRVRLLPPAGVVEGGRIGADPDRVLEAIQHAAKTAEGGELVVRAGDVVGRVYIWKGKIAWAHCTARDVSLAEYLIDVGGADGEEIKFAYEHCRRTGANFAETLIDFGTFERSQMRHVLCQHLRAHLDSVLELPQPELLFLPQSRVYNSDLLFPLSALLSHRERPRSRIIGALREKSLVARPA